MDRWTGEEWSEERQKEEMDMEVRENQPCLCVWKISFTLFRWQKGRKTGWTDAGRTARKSKEGEERQRKHKQELATEL